jgi:hypothetical protein
MADISIASAAMKPLAIVVPPSLLVVLSLSHSALAQGVGGYSAGPGLAPAQEKQVEQPNAAQPAAPTAPSTSEQPPSDTTVEGNDEDQPYETRVTTFRKSPTFTQDRQFTNARVWVLDPGRYTVEQWWTGSYGNTVMDRNFTNTEGHFFQTEIEMGVARHVQVDIYFNYEFAQTSNGGLEIAKGGHTGVAAEVRVAIPEYWGQVWGNPTLYFELTSQYYNSPRAEGRLLLGGTMFTPRLMGAVNFSFERNIFRDQYSGIDYEIKSQWGANYDIIPGWFRAGAEATFGWDSHGTINPDGSSGLHPVAQIGPSVLFTIPSRFFKVLGTVLFGLADYDAPYQPQIIASCTF